MRVTEQGQGGAAHEPARVRPDMSIAETIARYPRTIPVFQLHAIVACCRPERTLHNAAIRFHADEPALLRMLEDAARE